MEEFLSEILLLQKNTLKTNFETIKKLVTGFNAELLLELDNDISMIINLMDGIEAKIMARRIRLWP